MQEFFSICKSVNVNDHLNRCRKPFDKIQHPFMIKTLQNMGIEGTYLNIVKAIYDKPTAYIILNAENIPCKIRSKTRVPTFPTIIQRSSGSLNYRNQRRRKNKGIQIGKEVKLSLQMTLYCT